jgi:glucose-1-phosphate thymidylyltransferase
MDVLILGGGYGTRLFGKYNSFNYSPKGLVSVNGKSCIDITLTAFSPNLFDRIILETNNEGRKFYLDWSKNSDFKQNIEIFVDEISTPENSLGVLSTINLVNDYYKFNSPVLVISPDNLFTHNQDRLIECFTEGVRIATYSLGSLEDSKKYGVVELSGNKIISCCEKPLYPKSKIVRTSCEIWDPEVFSLILEWIVDNNSDKVGDFINFLINKNIRVESCPVIGKWMDIGSPDDLNKARVMFG